MYKKRGYGISPRINHGVLDSHRAKIGRSRKHIVYRLNAAANHYFLGLAADISFVAFLPFLARRFIEKRSFSVCFINKQKLNKRIVLARAVRKLFCGDGTLLGVEIARHDYRA